MTPNYTHRITIFNDMKKSIDQSNEFQFSTFVKVYYCCYFWQIFHSGAQKTQQWIQQMLEQDYLIYSYQGRNEGYGATSLYQCLIITLFCIAIICGHDITTWCYPTRYL